MTSARNELAAAQQTDRLEADYQTALRMLDAGHWHQAIDKLERIAQVNPAYRATPALLNQARRQLAEAKPPPPQPSAAQAKPPPQQPSAAGDGRRPSGRPADGIAAHVSQGKSLNKAHRYADAEAAYRAALALGPHLAIAHAGLGDALNEQRRFAEAETACREAIRLDPGLANGYTGLGDVLMKWNRHREAEEAYREAARVDPDSAGLNRFAASMAKLTRWVAI